MNKKDTGIGLEITMLSLLLFATLVIIILGLFSPANAQEPAPISTIFQVSCLEVLSEDHYHLHINYVSDGVERFTFAMGDVIGASAETVPYTGHATTNIPASFVTSIGSNEDFYLDAHSEDSPYSFTLLFTNDIGTAVLPANTWDNVPECAPQPLPQTAPLQNAPEPIVALLTGQPVVSTGRVCVVKYLKDKKVILVCSG